MYPSFRFSTILSFLALFFYVMVGGVMGSKVLVNRE